jgi:hypothetical protein
MKEQRYSTLGKLSLPILTYESITEGDNAAGKQGAMLEAANDNLAYRGALAEGRDLITEWLEGHSNIERKTKETGKKDDKGQPILSYDETQKTYVDRVCTAKSWVTADGDADLSQFQAHVDTLARSIKGDDGKVYALAVDAKARERKPVAPKKLAKKYAEAAASWPGHANWPKFVAAFEKAFSRQLTKPNTPQETEQLGWAIKEYLDWKEAAALAKGPTI